MKILLTGAFDYSESQLNRIKKLGHEFIFIKDERLPLEVDVSDIEGVICNGLFLFNDIKAFENLKFIQLTSAGLDRVPLKYIQDHNIRLENAKGVYSVPMAEWAILKILEVYKKSRTFSEFQKKNKWEKQRDIFELSNKTVAVLGFGNVGSEIGKRLKGFDVNVIGVGKRLINTPYANELYSIKDLDIVLKKSDVVVITLPLTEETKHLIDLEKLEMMKQDAVLINISRGSIIDESALCEILDRGKFLGVALDVFETEPLPENDKLWNYDRVLISPHNSFISDLNGGKLFDLFVENLNYFVNEK